MKIKMGLRKPWPFFAYQKLFPCTCRELVIGPFWFYFQDKYCPYEAIIPADWKDNE